MSRFLYIFIAFLLGIILCICFILRELFGKLTWTKIKKLWSILND